MREVDPVCGTTGTTRDGRSELATLLEFIREGDVLVVTRMTKEPVSTWTYNEGVLTVQHQGKSISLGRYATHEHAAKAAAMYFAKHGGQRSA